MVCVNVHRLSRGGQLLWKWIKEEKKSNVCKWVLCMCTFVRSFIWCKGNFWLSSIKLTFRYVEIKSIQNSSIYLYCQPSFFTQTKISFANPFLLSNFFRLFIVLFQLRATEIFFVHKFSAIVCHYIEQHIYGLTHSNYSSISIPFPFYTT